MFKALVISLAISVAAPVQPDIILEFPAEGITQYWVNTYLGNDGTYCIQWDNNGNVEFW